jgi:uncharacterized protein YodC (DUF2158 family)
MATKAVFKVGQLVKLKSGGPDMTVQEVNEPSQYRPAHTYGCQWFAGKKLDKGTFPGESLNPVEPEE